MEESVPLRLDPLIPNSRVGRLASPFAQGRDEMEIAAGIDVSKKRLDLYVHPVGTAFSLDNDETGLAALVERLGAAKLD